MADNKKSGSLPTEEALVELINKSGKALGRRELARHFKLATSDRRALGAILETLSETGKIRRGRNRRYMATNHLPSVSVLEVSGLDDDGEIILRPTDQRFDKAPPRIRVNTRGLKGPAPGIGDKVLARLEQKRGGYLAHIIKRLEQRPSNIIGIFRQQPDSGIVEPADRRLKTNFLIDNRDTADAEDGELVECETVSGREHGLPLARIIARFGDSEDPSSIIPALIAKHEIPKTFPSAALRQAEQAKAASMEGRDDFRDIPLVTIDDETARDFDDAVWAERNESDNGWHLIVAIADVASYVRSDDALDKVAQERGNSVYFPTTVIPMLPEELSNGWCSLVPNQDRPCLAVEIWIDDNGHKTGHKFRRAMMRSAARLTYIQVQNTRDGILEDNCPPIAIDVVPNLYGAFKALDNARHARGVIDLDLAERKIAIDRDGAITGVDVRIRLDSHRLIEEFMILANVCAAETLEAVKMPCMYRIHDDPAADRVAALRKYLKTIDLDLSGGQAVRPRHFATLLQNAKDRPDFMGIQDAILRCQSQAVYSPNNVGHFGLALRRYAHFTSPIRRYSDLLVHRALIRGLNLGDDGLGIEDADDFSRIGEHISTTERRAMAAERDAFDRLATIYLSNRVGAEFNARITGVERFGLFAELLDIGASGLIPVSTLEGGYYRLDTDRRGLFLDGSNSGYKLGQFLRVLLKEANVATGGLLIEPAEQQTEKNKGTKPHHQRKNTRNKRPRTKRRR
ncbi:MAG: ribonuclease R [Alphaproteobacteria bacterium]|nr:ribonuclease R [Alphaproteobacteria bacterium]